MVAVADGAFEVLKTLEQGSVLGLSLSPDDRYIVYDTASDAGSSQSDIFVLDVESKQETPLVAHAAAKAPPVPPRRARRMLSLSSWRSRRCRVAPSPARNAISR